MSRVWPMVRFIAAALLLFSAGALVSRPAVADEQTCDAQADFALGREDYPAAIKLHREILESQPDNALAHYHLGFAYAMTGRSAEEINEYVTAVRLGLHNWDLFLNLGLAYLGLHELNLAADALATAESLAPYHPEPHVNLALVYESEGQLSKALDEITFARRLAPADPDAANTNAIICIEMGDTARARNIWTRLSEVAPDYAPARSNLSILNCAGAHYGLSSKSSGQPLSAEAAVLHDKSFACASDSIEKDDPGN
jgi:Flp pilus assembly protein TadD